MLKYLAIVALLLLLLLLLYSRLQPYIQLLKKVFTTVKAFTESPPPSTEKRPSAGIDSKLVKCVSCSTWIPAERALSSGSSVYCSRECQEKTGGNRERKIAG